MGQVVQAKSRKANDGHYYDAMVFDIWGPDDYWILFDDGEFQPGTAEVDIRLPQDILSSLVCLFHVYFTLLTN